MSSSSGPPVATELSGGASSSVRLREVNRKGSACSAHEDCDGVTTSELEPGEEVSSNTSSPSGNDASEGCNCPNMRKMYWQSSSWTPSSSARQVSRSLSKRRAANGKAKGLRIEISENEDFDREGRGDIVVGGGGSVKENLSLLPLQKKLGLGGAGMQLDLSAVRRVSEEVSEQTEIQQRRSKFAFFEKRVSQVAEHVYLGSDVVARNRETLREAGISHVLNCVGFVCPEYFVGDLVYKTLWLQDTPGEDITSILYDVFDYLEDVKAAGGRCLVHCCQGVSRSTSLVIAYLMWRDGHPYDETFYAVKAIRGTTNPNMGFACQLLQWQKRLGGATPTLTSPRSSQLPRLYRLGPHDQYNPFHLVPKSVLKVTPESLDTRGAFVLHSAKGVIHVWAGKSCRPSLAASAGRAAAQLVKYETASGPISAIREGQEPGEFWEAIRTSGDAGCERERSLGGQNEEYDADYEMFVQAESGRIAPAVPGSMMHTSSPHIRGQGRDTPSTPQARRSFSLPHSHSQDDTSSEKPAPESPPLTSRRSSAPEASATESKLARSNSALNHYSSPEEPAQQAAAEYLANLTLPSASPASSASSPGGNASVPDQSQSPSSATESTSTTKPTGVVKPLGLVRITPPPATEDAPPETPRGGRTRGPLPFGRLQNLDTHRGEKRAPPQADITLPGKELKLPARVDDELSSRGVELVEQRGGVEAPLSQPPPEEKIPRLFVLPAMEEVKMFDADDLDPSNIYALWVGPHRRGSSTGEHVVFVWVGSDSQVGGEEEGEFEGASSGVEALGKRFVRASMLSGTTPIKVVMEGEEPDDFWAHFVNG